MSEKSVESKESVSVLSESDSIVDLIEDSVIDRIANQKNAFFKSQQKDENDLTFTQKRLIVQQLFNDNKEVFLQRYGSYLLDEDLNYFDKFSDNYVIKCLLNSLRKMLNQNKNKIIVKNRRFEALQTLIKKGEYFSDCEMQSRNPFLFEEMVGQYMSENEKRELTEKKYFKNYERIAFSSFLLEQMENSEIEKRFQMQEEMEDNMREESDSDDNESQYSEASGLQTNTSLDSNERQRLREEFKKIMFEQFLTGKDSEFFDYKRVDHNNEYDCNEIEDRDVEEEYFDAEDSNQ